MLNYYSMADKEKECQSAMLPILDSMYVLQGKWKLPIILALTFNTRGFRELEREVLAITPRMLSKELKHLEENQLVERKVYDSKPIRVEYSLTNHGKTLKPLILALRDWGLKHRNAIMIKDSPNKTSC